MKTELINALRKTAQDLREGTKKYNWWSASSCNCGCLARNVGNTTIEDIRQHIHAAWSDTCAITGIEMNVVVSRLIAIGMSKEDIYNLEILGDEKILTESVLSKDGFDSSLPMRKYRDKNHVIAYMDAWANILEREGQPQYPNITAELSAEANRDKVETDLILHNQKA